MIQRMIVVHVENDMERACVWHTPWKHGRVYFSFAVIDRSRSHFVVMQQSRYNQCMEFDCHLWRATW